jgi:hypothetical protein
MSGQVDGWVEISLPDQRCMGKGKGKREKRRKREGTQGSK